MISVLGYLFFSITHFIIDVIWYWLTSYMRFMNMNELLCVCMDFRCSTCKQINTHEPKLPGCTNSGRLPYLNLIITSYSHTQRSIITVCLSHIVPSYFGFLHLILKLLLTIKMQNKETTYRANPKSMEHTKQRTAFSVLGFPSPTLTKWIIDIFSFSFLINWDINSFCDTK